MREAVSGYRTKLLADELASAAQTLDAAGIHFDRTIRMPDPAPGIDHALGWFVREGITNVIRHAAATRVHLSLLEHRGTITAELEDNGQGPATAINEDRGNGLRGLRERLAALGGTLETGPVPDGGFRLRAILPAAGDTCAPDTATGAEAPAHEAITA